MALPDALRFNYLFRGLDEDAIDLIMAMADTQPLRDGDVLFRRGDPTGNVFIVLSGEVRILGPLGEAVAEIPRGNVIGEVALVDHEPRSATVVSAGDSMVARVPLASLQLLMAGNVTVKATLMENLARVLCARLRHTTEDLDATLARS